MSEHESPPIVKEAHGASGKAGLIVFVVLAIMTIVEYIIATNLDQKLLILVVIVIIKAALILWFFMHVARAWIKNGGSH